MQALLFSLVHSLWQAVLVVGVLWVFLRVVPQGYVRVRYGASVGALLVVLFAACATWSLQYHPLSWPVHGEVVVGGHEASSGMQAPPPCRLNSGDTGDNHFFHGGQWRWDWTLVLVVGWGVGVAGMLVRMFFSLGRAAKWVGVGEPVDLPMVGELAKQLRLRRSFKVLVSSLYRVPAVVGTWSPVLLVPASILAEMSPEQLRLIIAHELAHVRRWDFLVNLMQQVVEALLFFNPAVWWISGQIRQEREACCDALAVSCAGSRELLARTLTDVAIRIGSDPAPRGAVLAITGHGPLWRRIVRLISPTDSVRIGFPLGSLVLGLFVSALMLAILASTAELTVRAAEKMLSPAERVKQITELEKEHQPHRFGGESRGSMILTGHVRTADGRPLPTQLKDVLIRTIRPGSLHMSQASVAADGSFESMAIPAGRVVVWTATDDEGSFAPAVSSPVTVGADGKYPPVELVLPVGFPARIRVVNRAGDAIANASVTLGYNVEEKDTLNYNAGTVRLTSDADGSAVVPQAIDRAAGIWVRAAGYQNVEVLPLRLSPEDRGGPAVITLNAARPATGLVRDAVSGEPIAGASISFLSSRVPDNHPARWLNRDGQGPWSSIFSRDLLATTDEAGRFALTELHDDCTYRIYVSHPEHAAQWLVVKAGQTLDVKLGPLQPITLEIHADAGGMPRDVWAGFSFPKAERLEQASSIKLPVTVDERGIGRAVLANPLPTLITFRPPDGPQRVNAMPGKDSVVSLDLRATSKPPTRLVIIRVVVPEGSPPAVGTVLTDVRFPVGAQTKYNNLKITNNEARVDVPVPSQFRAGAPKLMGYRVVDKHYLYNDLSASDEPFVITFEAQPAGAIHGHVIGPDGKPWEAHAYARLITIEKSSELAANESLNISDNVQSDRTSYLLSPVPLGGRYRVVCSAKAMFAISDEIVLDAKRPIAEIPITFSPGITVSGIIRNPDNTPAAHIEVELSYNNEVSSFNSSTRSDREGRFAFENVDPKLSLPGGNYRLVVTPGVTTQGFSRKIALSDKPPPPLEIVLEAGHVIRGTVIHAGTGEPLADVRVWAIPDFSQGELHYSARIETTTNAKGEFEYRNLEAVSHTIYVLDHDPEGSQVVRQPDGTLRISSHPQPTVKAGQAEPVILRVMPRPDR
ncbi:MAG: M48 family metalloprotease [Phycisphaerales bacterium]|nr:M48 family metalloprotease [Phycisphaerales bacterium]